jgi:predicted N-acetyltransferase YhbS
MVEISEQTVADDLAIEALMASAFGNTLYNRSVWLLRTLPPVANLCLVMRGTSFMLASLRFWEVRLNEQIVLLLGPLAVQRDLWGQGYGQQIVEEGIARTKIIGKWPLILVSGEPDYYPKFGFIPAAPYLLQWPGFVEPERLQVLELQNGALDALTPPLRVQGMVSKIEL